MDNGGHVHLHTLETLARSLARNPALRAAARTYSLALTLSLSPALLPFLTRRRKLNALLGVLRRELGPTGFAFSMTVAVGGGALLQRLLDGWTRSKDGQSTSGPSTGPQRIQQRAPSHYASIVREWLDKLGPPRRAFLSNLLSSLTALLLIQHGARRRRLARSRVVELPYTPPVPRSGDKLSPTLDLSLMFFVRAMDVLVQSGLRSWWLKEHSLLIPENPPKEGTRNLELWISRVDAFIFWACSARIMWCFFYRPKSLPRSYVKWISNLADLDDRIVLALQGIRKGDFSYVHGTLPALYPELTTSLSKELGCPPAWGHPGSVPAYGGHNATAVWRSLGVTNRDGIGGLPCELIHGASDRTSCSLNAGRRGVNAFLKALVIYIPVHLLPVLLARPRHLLDPSRLSTRLIAIIRSASFLSTFVSSIWLSVCLTRTLLLARLFPGISHDVFDGPLGCTMAGCLACGGSIWIENGRRRGEMALYVLPRAIRSCLSYRWLRSGGALTKITESAVFSASLATLLTAAVYRPESLRGLSRWALTFLIEPEGNNVLKEKANDVVTDRRTDEQNTQ